MDTERTTYAAAAALAIVLCMASPAPAGSPSARERSDDAQAVSLAEPTRDFAETGAYLAAGGGLGFQDFESPVLGLPARSHTTPDLLGGMFNLRAGHRFGAWMAAELLWEYYTGWDFQVLNGSPQRTDLSGWSLTANLKVFASRSRFQPFVVVGGGIGRLGHGSRGTSCERNGTGCRDFSNDDEEGFVPRFGAGLDVHVTEAWRVGVEGAYLLGRGGLEDMSWATAGLVLACRFR
ncbi:MAG TPA: outer membrane beta-barrel protein [Candidatus Limnocylindrales bacterium]|nr:outer membrane beta-barrel protein [Candidatus Limnocylindrales bacterium]